MDDSPTVAALYVDPRGAYRRRPGVDLWDAERDARQYDGPHPVIAHPPCAAWCRWAGVRERDGYGAAGDDGGCFEAALAAVRRFGGVLEHPAHSAAWRAFGLPEPLAGAMWCADTWGGWVCEIDQAEWGLRAHKQTWLYYVGDAPPTILTGWRDASRVCRDVKSMSSTHRHLTPGTLAADLIALVRAGCVPKASMSRAP